MINVYVAGSSRNKERARTFMDRVRAHPGMKLTYDWVADIDAAEVAGKRDQDFSDNARCEFANNDLDGLSDADVAVFLADDEMTSRGMWVELGYVLAVREGWENGAPILPIVIVSGGGKRSIFTAPGLVDHEVEYSAGDHDELAFTILETYAVES